MLARRYETRLDEDGLITFEKVWSKRINIHVKKNEFKHPEHIYELCGTAMGYGQCSGWPDAIIIVKGVKTL